MVLIHVGAIAWLTHCRPLEDGERRLVQQVVVVVQNLNLVTVAIRRIDVVGTGAQEKEQAAVVCIHRRTRVAGVDRSVGA